MNFTRENPVTSNTPAELLRKADRAMAARDKAQCVALIRRVYAALDACQTDQAHTDERHSGTTALTRVAGLVIAGWTLLVPLSDVLPAFA